MLLSLALEQAKTLGIRNVLVTCDKDNIASAKTIISNGESLSQKSSSREFKFKGTGLRTKAVSRSDCTWNWYLSDMLKESIR